MSCAIYVKRLPYVRNYLFPREKTCLLLFLARKTIKFAISHSFIIFYLFLTGPIPLRIRFLWLLPKREEFSFFYLFTLLSLSLSLHHYACHFFSLSLSRFIFAPEFREKGKKEEINDVAVTFNDLLRIILLLCLFLSTCCWLFILLTPQLKSQIYFFHLCCDYRIVIFFFWIFLWGFDFLVDNNGRFMEGKVVSNDFFAINHYSLVCQGGYRYSDNHVLFDYFGYIFDFKIFSR